MASVDISAGSGTHIATNSLTRDAQTEQMQLVNIGDPTTGNAQAVSTTGAARVTESHDIGRTPFCAYLDASVSFNQSVAEDTLSLSIAKGLTAPTTSQTSYTVTSGKVLRLTTIVPVAYSTTVTHVQFRIRTVSSGAVSNTSPIALAIPVAATTIPGGGFDLGDGFEFPSGQVLGFFIQHGASIPGSYSFAVSGYEYTP
jgi:hypothetical protein